MAFEHNNTDGKGYISQISLPDGKTYYIHDENAIHDLEDLGLSTPLNFKGIVDDYTRLPTGQALQAYTIDTYLEIYNGNRTTVAWSGINEILQNPAYYPLEITYHEESADSVTLTNILKTPQTTWRSESFSSLLFSDADKEQLYYDQAINILSVVGLGQTTAKVYRSDYGKSITQISLTLTSIPHNGDVYLVKDDNDTTPDQEYVYIIPDDDSNPYWEPLGSVHDAASSKHTHNVAATVTATSGATKFVTGITAPTNTLAYQKVSNVATIQQSGSNGTAPEWTASVANGVLTIGWKPGKITTLPTFGTVDASYMDMTIGHEIQTQGHFTTVTSVTPTTDVVTVSGSLNTTTTQPIE